MATTKYPVRIEACMTVVDLADQHAREEGLPDNDGISRLAGLAVIDAAVRESIRQAVWVARKDGRSWAEVGSVLGITRQAAQQRFGS